MAGSPTEHQQQVPVKVNAFRQFASGLMAQVTEQLCVEFEREVSVITEELVGYRTELARCGELLAHQLGREKQLHGMLESIAGTTGHLAASAGDFTQKHGANEGVKQQMHELVEQMFGHSSTLLSSTVNGVNETHSVANTHLSQAKELQNQSLDAENELNRIMGLLSLPPVPAAPVAPAVATPRSLRAQQASATVSSQVSTSLSAERRPSQVTGMTSPSHPSLLSGSSPLPQYNGMPSEGAPNGRSPGQLHLGLPPSLGVPAPSYTGGSPLHAPAPSGCSPGTCRSGVSAVSSPPKDLRTTTCKNCGNVYMSDSLFCRKCGHRREDHANSHLEVNSIHNTFQDQAHHYLHDMR
eukprot:TRINITY_DN34887_c0_g1_i1.p1 TRINITY_DN34887_c0_g1~~TRINITY_DN34887_c0_g1_i1.p1  ORF type:complete len:371 (+),score=50.70 TRINITY_DN34887_c0_g1_i1:56-1114(+)